MIENEHTDGALLFDFTNAHNASMAYATLQELGFTPVRHGSGQLHIHLNRGDLTSALEIAMAHGGRLAGESDIEDDALFCSAYDTDAIPIPAHIVNDDFESSSNEAAGDVQELQNRDSEGMHAADYLPGHDDYGFFSGDVKA